MRSACPPPPRHIAVSEHAQGPPLSLFQLRLLVALGENDGAGNTDLALQLRSTRPAVSVTLDRLEDDGFLRREISTTDRRRIQVFLEPAGRRIAEHQAD